MTDGHVEIVPKKKGRSRTFSDDQAMRAYRLYKVENMTGEQVAAALKRKRTTCLLMVTFAEQHLLNGQSSEMP